MSHLTAFTAGVAGATLTLAHTGIQPTYGDGVIIALIALFFGFCILAKRYLP